MIYLDTHVIIWLYEGYLTKFSKSTLRLIEENNLIISAMTLVELKILHEIKRLAVLPEDMITHLKQTIGLNVCHLPLNDIAVQAMKLNWTRDPFDRLIVANAMTKLKPLITKDKIIHKHYKLAVW